MKENVLDTPPIGPYCVLASSYHRNPAYEYAIQFSTVAHPEEEWHWTTWKLYRTIQDVLNAYRDIKGFAWMRIVHVYYDTDSYHGRYPKW